MDEKKYSVYAFDFDGTLTSRDSFIAFLAYSVGGARLAGYLFRLLPSFAALLLHRISLQRAKERLFSCCFRGMPLEEFDRLCASFAESHADILRSRGMDYLTRLCREQPVIIISASIKNYVEAFFRGLPLTVEATCPEVDQSGRLTGKFLGRNCKGQEKVLRLTGHYPDRQDYRLIAFGDSSGDRELLAFADEAHWKPFRT